MKKTQYFKVIAKMMKPKHKYFAFLNKLILVSNGFFAYGNSFKVMKDAHNVCDTLKIIIRVNLVSMCVCVQLFSTKNAFYDLD